MVSMGQGSCARNKWSLLNAIERSRVPLGLKGTSIAILRAMVSLIKGDHITNASDDGHICFASNATLAQRSHVSIQTVERHISRLVSLGLLQRHSSANGKRWARRNQNGQIVLASGISLYPLEARHEEFNQLAHKHEEHQTQLRIIRDRISQAMVKLKQHSTDSSTVEKLTTKARNLLRRKTSRETLDQLLHEISVEISARDETVPLKTMVTETSNEGHKDTDKIQYVEKNETAKPEISQTEIERSFPKLCAEIRFARNNAECLAVMDRLASNLSLNDAWIRARQLGPTYSFLLLGYLLEKSQNIKSPEAYLKALLKQHEGNHLSWPTLLKTRVFS